MGYVTLTGASSITAPIAGAFSPDNTLFFVSTSGDNKVHYIDTNTLKEMQQITPQPARLHAGRIWRQRPGLQIANYIHGQSSSGHGITVKPRTTT